MTTLDSTFKRLNNPGWQQTVSDPWLLRATFDAWRKSNLFFPVVVASNNYLNKKHDSVFDPDLCDPFKGYG